MDILDKKTSESFSEILFNIIQNSKNNTELLAKQKENSLQAKQYLSIMENHNTLMRRIKR
ncbi:MULTISPECIES: hypothetical protein [Clostridium]|uniref:hypothetical protein n=1 Tax=Clostridium TaxID=1485 RepID=UPI000E869801|nr:hypothetical protein [Clostridium tyrobutyricum]HBF76914.1 hypothetical protein [Clostridiaceae bacterium]